MRILVLHNRYRQPGGEDAAVELETRLLREHGHEVILFEAGNAPVEGAAGLVRLTRNCAWSDSSYKQVLRLCREHRPDVAHVHNFWMTLSPSVHAACHEAGVPTVQTLHNYRLLCPNALLMRDGRVCEECVGGAPWRGVLHRCYRNSILASAAVAWMISANRQRDTWNRHVDAFLVPSEFARTRFVEGGFDANRILVKPNLIADPGRPCTRPSASNMVLYAGRLSAEKGLGTLLAAWASARLDDIGQLLIAGDGPQESELRGQAQALGLTGVRFTGRMDRA